MRLMFFLFGLIYVGIIGWGIWTELPLMALIGFIGVAWCGVGFHYCVKFDLY